eukprot:7614240-Alexandrium_andersonii.AAC.1
MFYYLRQSPVEEQAAPGTHNVGVQAPSLDALPNPDGQAGLAATSGTAGLAAAGDARSSTS